MMPTESILPTCAICNRPVERLVRKHDNMAETVILRAYCHGDFETVEIESEAFETGARISLGKAFERKALPGRSGRELEGR